MVESETEREEVRVESETGMETQQSNWVNGIKELRQRLLNEVGFWKIRRRVEQNVVTEQNSNEDTDYMKEWNGVLLPI